MKNLTQKFAFTLAEVIITLAIIGIVAALTIPSMIQQHKKRVVETRLLKFYTTINQAIVLSEIENGPKETWPRIGNGFEELEDGSFDYSKSLPDAWCRKYILPYINFVKYDFNKKKGWGELYFTDGSFVLIAEDAIIFYPEAKDYKLLENEEGEISVDYSGGGTKQFDFYFAPANISPCAIHHINKGVEPYKFCWDGTRQQLLEGKEGEGWDYACKTDARDPALCTALIQLNNWKIPDDYPFKF